MITDKKIANIERALNARPRDCLGMQQLAVVFDDLHRAAYKLLMLFVVNLNSVSAQFSYIR
ncbi:hypothetical protein AEA42_08415 [Shewanella sp. Sh95]|nr:hypothetical protein AEA42_08415 [Shewanella sp. Sh95]